MSSSHLRSPKLSFTRTQDSELRSRDVQVGCAIHPEHTLLLFVRLNQSGELRPKKAPKKKDKSVSDKSSFIMELLGPGASMQATREAKAKELGAGDPSAGPSASNKGPKDKSGKRPKSIPATAPHLLR